MWAVLVRGRLLRGGVRLGLQQRCGLLSNSHAAPAAGEARARSACVFGRYVGDGLGRRDLWTASSLTAPSAGPVCSTPSPHCLCGMRTLYLTHIAAHPDVDKMPGEGVWA